MMKYNMASFNVDDRLPSHRLRTMGSIPLMRHRLTRMRIAHDLAFCVTFSEK